MTASKVYKEASYALKKDQSTLQMVQEAKAARTIQGSPL